jgi:YD repeat-containing protein
LLIVFDNTLIITTDIFGSFGDLSLVVIGNGICTISGIDVDILTMLRTNKDNSIIVLEYDELGNKTKSVDPAMGVWSYVYNGFGELTQHC